MRNYILIFTLLLGFNFSCNRPQTSDRPVRIFYVNSYHSGYGSSDDVMKGMQEAFRGKNLLLKTFFLDAKRKTSEKEVKEMVRKALEEIEKFKPGLLIVSDDNALKELVVPHFNHTHLPVIFCSVNWSAAEYNLGKNVTGMLEVLPLRECLSEVIFNYPETKKLVVLSENSLSEQNNKNLLDTLYRNLNLQVTYSLVNDFETWKALFLEACETGDLIYMPTNGAVKNWDEKEAISFVRNNLDIPAITCDDFMMPYAVFGLTKVAREQGEWAAKTALEISGGREPSEIPYTKNTQTKAWLNKTLAEKIDFKLSDQMEQRVIRF